MKKPGAVCCACLVALAVVVGVDESASAQNGGRVVRRQVIYPGQQLLPDTGRTYMDGSMSRTAAQQAGGGAAIVGLPKVIHSEFVGTPGEGVSNPARSANTLGTAGGGSTGSAAVASPLPKVQSGAYIGTPSASIATHWTGGSKGSKTAVRAGQKRTSVHSQDMYSYTSPYSRNPYAGEESIKTSH